MQLARARAQFVARGESVADWARKRGYGTTLVYHILAGRCHCQRGASHEIAVALGLKPRVPASQPDTFVEESTM